MNFRITSFAGLLNMILYPFVLKKEWELFATWLYYREYWQTFIPPSTIFLYGSAGPATLTVTGQKKAGMVKEEQKRKQMLLCKVSEKSVRIQIYQWPGLQLSGYWKIRQLLVHLWVPEVSDELEENVKAICTPLSENIRTELDRITFPVKEKLGNHFDYYESAENDRTI